MVSQSDTVALLHRVPVFETLAEADLSEVAEVAVPRRLAAGEIVFREGDESDTCYIVRTGHARAIREHGDGRTLTLAHFGPGDIFGELAMFGGETRSATVEAVEAATAVAILAGDLRRLMRDHPEIAVKMLGGLADRLRAANERISRQSFQTVAGRVASALLAQVETRSDGGAEGGQIVIHATQSQIAQLAGASRESASRFLAKLERAGVITTGRGRVTVHEPDALHNYIY